MVYRLKYPSSPFPSHPSFLFLSRLSFPRIRFPFQPNHLLFSPVWRWKEREKRTPSTPFDLAIVIFFQILPFSKLHHPSDRQEQKKKKRDRPSIRPHVAFRAIVSAKSRYTNAAIVLLDIHSTSKEVRGAVAKIALYATIRQTEMSVCRPSLAFESLR